MARPKTVTPSAAATADLTGPEIIERHLGTIATVADALALKDRPERNHVLASQAWSPTSPGENGFFYARNGMLMTGRGTFRTSTVAELPLTYGRVLEPTHEASAFACFAVVRDANIATRSRSTGWADETGPVLASRGLYVGPDIDLAVASTLALPALMWDGTPPAPDGSGPSGYSFVWEGSWTPLSAAEMDLFLLRLSTISGAALKKRGGSSATPGKGGGGSNMPLPPDLSPDPAEAESGEGDLGGVEPAIIRPDDPSDYAEIVWRAGGVLFAPTESSGRDDGTYHHLATEERLNDVASVTASHCARPEDIKEVLLAGIPDRHLVLCRPRVVGFKKDVFIGDPVASGSRNPTWLLLGGGLTTVDPSGSVEDTIARCKAEGWEAGEYVAPISAGACVIIAPAKAGKSVVARALTGRNPSRGFDRAWLSKMAECASHVRGGSTRANIKALIDDAGTLIRLVRDARAAGERPTVSSLVIDSVRLALLDATSTGARTQGLSDTFMHIVAALQTAGEAEGVLFACVFNLTGRTIGPDTHEALIGGATAVLSVASAVPTGVSNGRATIQASGSLESRANGRRMQAITFDELFNARAFDGGDIVPVSSIPNSTTVRVSRR